MYERSYGYRYADLGAHPSTADIAKAIRGDVKQAKEEGLPARLAERKAAREAGTICGKVTNYKRDGLPVTHLVVEIATPEGHVATRKALACGARSWSGASMSRAHDDAEVTCSRCAKAAAKLQASVAVL